MLDLTSVTGTDDWWLARLCDTLGAGLPRMVKLKSYRDGDALLPANSWEVGTRDSYLRFMKRSRLHVVETIRDARTDRQHVTGFRTAVGGDEDGDLEAWRIWNANRMGLQERPFFNDTADFGKAYILTTRDVDGPVWGIRNEFNTITEQNGTRPWLTQAGISVGFDPSANLETVVLFRPGYYRIAGRRTMFATLPNDGSPWAGGADWDWLTDPIPTDYTRDALLQQNKTVDGFGVWEKHLDSVDRINEITLNALTLIVTQAFRQRGVKGNLPTHFPEGHPQAGEEIDYDEMFKAGPAALWMLPVGADIWESAPTDIRPIYEARKEELKTLMSNTRTPQDLFDGESNNQSAKGADISREPLIAAVRNMNAQAAVTFAQSMAISFQMKGDIERAQAGDIETMWAKIQSESLQAKAEAAAKYKTGGATQAYIDEEVFEMTPAQRRQAKNDRADEALVSAIGATDAGD